MREADGNHSRPRDPQRLVDEAGAPSSMTASETWARDLLRVAAPYAAPAGRKQRVQLSLGHVPARRAPLLVRLAVAGLVLFGCGAIASAALGRATSGRWPAWMAEAYERLVSSAAPRRAPVASAAPAAHAAATPSLEPPPVAGPPAPAVALVAPPAPRVARDPALALRARRAAPAPLAAAASTEDTSPVLEAMRALRLERNPVRARALLARYLERHPTGTLAEEALAISIEAAVAHRDPDATALAARYLRLYPLGPFRSLARQTFAGEPPSAAAP
jgi:hypothetical protein